MDPSGAERIPYPCPGVVLRNDDPDGLHRIKANLPGVMDETPWCLPLTAGGGGPQRGGHVVPAVGDTVVVQFLLGDPTAPVYTAAWWGRPDAGSEMPVDARDVGAQAHQVQVLQIGGVRLVVDERPGSMALRVGAYKDGLSEPIGLLEIDLEGEGVTLTGFAGLLLKSNGIVQVEAPVINLGDRSVMTSSKPV